MLEHLKSHLNGKVVILGMGNTLSSDDAVGSILASRIKDKVPYTVYDAGANPENYLGKIIKDKPDNIVIIDAVDFGAKPGDYAVLEGKDIKTVNLFATHNASISLTINYLQNNLKVDIIILAIQPKTVAFGDKISQEVENTLTKLEDWFSRLTRSVKY
jgi:hydrogenase maturation protease HycI